MFKLNWTVLIVYHFISNSLDILPVWQFKEPSEHWHMEAINDSQMVFIGIILNLDRVWCCHTLLNQNVPFFWKLISLYLYILLNKSLARILMRCPTLNEHEPFYLMLSTCMGILKFTFFRVRQTISYLVRRRWIDVKFDVMGMQRIHVHIWN